MGVSFPISVWLTWGGYFSHSGILLTQGSRDFYTGLYTGVLLTQQRSCAAWGVCELRAWVRNNCSVVGGELAGNSKSQGQKGHQILTQSWVQVWHPPLPGSVTIPGKWSQPLSEQPGK